MFIQFYKHGNYKGYRLWYIKLIKDIFVSKKNRETEYFIDQNIKFTDQN